MDMDLRRIRSTFSERDAYIVLPGLPQEVVVDASQPPWVVVGQSGHCDWLVISDNRGTVGVDVD